MQERIERCEKTLNDKLMELSSQTGQFLLQDAPAGDCLESEASKHHHHGDGAWGQVTAKGNVIILEESYGDRDPRMQRCLSNMV